MIYAGVAQITITPPVGTCMLEPPGIPTTGVHADLYCRALVLADGAQRIAIVTLDLLGMDTPLLWRTRQVVWQQAGIPAANLMLTATHNHSAPVTLDCGQDEHRNRAWEDTLVERIGTCVAQATQDLQPVTLAVGREDVQIGVNRRVAIMGRTRMLANPYTSIIPYVDVLRVDRADGSRLAVLFTHAAHPVTVHTASTEFNADYPGFAVRYLKEALGAGVMPLFAQGCAGDINVESLAAGIEEARRLGTDLGQAAEKAVGNAEPIHVDRLHIANHETILPYEHIVPEMLDALAERINESAQALPAHDSDPRVLHDQRMLSQWVERVRHAPPGLRFQAQGIAFGDQLVVIGMTHELFAAYQIAIQARSPFPHTMTFGYTNGCNGYIPTAEAFYLGGYEVEGAPKLFGVPRLQPTSETLVHVIVDALLAELFALSAAHHQSGV